MRAIMKIFLIGCFVLNLTYAEKSKTPQKVLVELQKINKNLTTINSNQVFYGNLIVKFLILTVFFLAFYWLLSILNDSEGTKEPEDLRSPKRQKDQNHTTIIPDLPVIKRQVTSDSKNSWDIAGYSNKGNVRKNNEDSVSTFKIDQLQIAVVADGLGGMPKGKEASSLVVNTIQDFFIETYTQNIDYWYKNKSMLLLTAIHFASLQITSHAKKSHLKNSEGLRTTLILVIADEDSYYYAYIGDGGIACLRENGNIENIMIPQKVNESIPNILAASLGPIIEGKPAHGCLKREKGDLFVLGTDGIFDRVKVTQFGQYLRHSSFHNNGDLHKTILNTLTDLSEEKDENGNYIFDDNLTLVVLGTGDKPNLPTDYWKKINGQEVRMINKVITSKNNTKMLIRSVIGEGGQGKAYSATTRCSKKIELVVKLFNKSLNKKENLYRLEYLIDQQLENVSQLFAPPLDVITKGNLGYYAKKAPGITLEEMLTKPELLNLQEAIILAISICNGLKILNRMGILYCDIHPGNFIVHKKDNIPQLSIIDFDNFHSTSSKIPLPSCIGHILYLAPETRKLFLEGKPAILNQGTDNFALACLLHNIILFKHQATGRDNSQDEFHKAMMTGNWNHDPSCLSRTSNDVGGYPSEAMSPNISRLFRRGFSLTPSDRPGPQEWQQVLTKALNEIFVCNSCGGAFVIDISKESCPHCKVPFPILKLVFSDKQIPIDTSTLTVGRDNLGGDHTVSSKHAIFRRLGPETKVICIGSNPSFKWSSGKWIHLPNEKEIIVQENDRFRFSNLEVKII